MKKMLIILMMTLSIQSVSGSTSFQMDPGPWRTKVCAFHGVLYATITGFESFLVCPLANTVLYSQTQIPGHEHRDDVHDEECYSSRYQN